MKRKIKYVLHWEPKARREKSWQAFAGALGRKGRQEKNGGKRHVL